MCLTAAELHPQLGAKGMTHLRAVSQTHPTLTQHLDLRGGRMDDICIFD